VPKAIDALPAHEHPLVKRAIELLNARVINVTPRGG
jgi:hypothetical protein